jgi:hypothetical protein
MAGFNNHTDGHSTYNDHHCDTSPVDSELMLNGDITEKMRLQQLTLLSPVPIRRGQSPDSIRTSRRTSVPVHLLNHHSPYPGDDDDHSKRVLTRDALSPSPRQDEQRRAEQKSTESLAELSDCYRNILIGVGEDPERQGLRQTPERAARAMLYFTKGYDEKVEGNCKSSTTTTTTMTMTMTMTTTLVGVM